MIENQWYAVLPSRAVRNNAVLGATRLGMQLVFFRDAGGALGCVSDRCTHRGAALSKGKVVDGCVQCPFHGLRFDTRGQCTQVPADGAFSTENLSRFDVAHHPVVEHAGIVYVWYGEASKAVGEPPFFSDQVDSSYVFSEMEDLWNAHYSRCIENQLDVVHLPFVHHNTIGRGNKTLVNGPKVLFENGALITSANNEIDNGQQPLERDQCVIKDTYLTFRFPNIWVNHISEKIKVLIYFAPVDEAHTVLYIRFYCKITGIRPLDGLIAWFGKFANGVIERQDKRVVITQMPKASSYISNENLLAGDYPIITYRRLREELKAAAIARPRTH